MRTTSTCIAAGLAIAACGDDATPPDAAAIDAAALDAVDALVVDACAPQTLFTGGVDPASQGWTVVMQPPATLSAEDDVTRLETHPGTTTSGQLLLTLPGAVTAPFAIEVRLQVLAAMPHNQFDAAVAILGSFTPPAGTSSERTQMIYVDPGRVGWADDTGRFDVPAIDGAFHTYRLAVDAAGAATVSRDGQPVLTRAGFVTNGTIAIGDQTNDPNVDATILVQSVVRDCP